jgi:TonB family protein
MFPLDRLLPSLRLTSLLCACCLLSPLYAQSTEADIMARLVDKPLYLRGFWGADKLRFDAAGKLIGTAPTVSFTLSGFEIRKVHLKKDKLVLEGRRIGLELADNQQKRVPLNAGIFPVTDDESLDIDIAAPPNGDYGSSLDAIFVNGLSDLSPLLPFYWKTYAGKNFNPAVPLHPPVSIEKPVRMDATVSPPKLLHPPVEPEFSQAARKLRYGGKVLVQLWVRPDGAVVNLSVVRALGIGLDERALLAVQHYSFSPAKQNDEPVLAELRVQVYFQIF